MANITCNVIDIKLGILETSRGELKFPVVYLDVPIVPENGYTTNQSFKPFTTPISTSCLGPEEPLTYSL